MKPEAWEFRFEASCLATYDIIRAALARAGEPVLNVDDHHAQRYSLPVALGPKQAVLVQLILAGAVAIELAYSADLKRSGGTWEPV